MFLLDFPFSFTLPPTGSKGASFLLIFHSISYFFLKSKKKNDSISIFLQKAPSADGGTATATGRGFSFPAEKIFRSEKQKSIDRNRPVCYNKLPIKGMYAPVAELADAMDLGSIIKRCAGSSPVRCTKARRSVRKTYRPSFLAFEDIFTCFKVDS